MAVDESIPEGEPRQREQLHRIWELAAVQQFLRSFRSVLGVSPLTSEDFHTAFLECSSALKVCDTRVLAFSLCLSSGAGISTGMIHERVLVAKLKR